MAVFLLLLAALVAFSARAKSIHPGLSWLIGALVMPFAILIQEFALPYQGGGASMWPIALAFGSLYGAIASLVGVVIAKVFFRSEGKNA